jgi:hypothetical protein
MNDKNVTDLVDFYTNDDERLPMIKCVCGKMYDVWDFTISVYREDARECKSCGAKFYFRNTIAVYQVREDQA